MKRFALILIAVLCAMGVAAQPPQLPPGMLLPRGSAAEEGIDPIALARFVDTLMAVPATDIHHLVVVRHGKVVAEVHPKPFHARDWHTLFSVSKTFTALAVGLAVDDKLLKVSDRVTTYFPDKLPPNVSPELARMTVEDLLTMHSGITPDWMLRDSVADWTAGWLAKEVDPKAPFQYDSMCSFMLAAIVQQVTGKTMLEYLQERLFTHMGITRAEWEQSPDGINTGGWGLRLTAEAQAKAGLLLLAKGRWEGRQLVSERWIDEMCKRQIYTKATTKPADDGNQGYGYQVWMCRLPGAVRAAGSYGQYIVAVPRLDLVVVINSMSHNGQLMLNAIWDVLVPGVKDKALLTDEAADYALETALYNARQEEVAPVAGLPKSSEKWHKSTAINLELDDNELGWNTIELRRQRGAGFPEITMMLNGDPLQRFSCGHGGWLSDRRPGAEYPFPPYHIKAQNRMVGLTPDFAPWNSYAWTRSHVIEIDQQWTTWYCARHVAIDLKGKTVTVTHSYAPKKQHVIPITKITTQK